MIIGIDPSTVKTGIALINNTDFQAKLIKTICLTTSWRTKNKHMDYCTSLGRFLQLFKKEKNIEVVVERPFIVYKKNDDGEKEIRNQKGFESHIKIISLVEYVLQKLDMKYEIIFPATWQNAIGCRTRGTGLKMKEQAKNIVLRYYDIPYEHSSRMNYDEFDALGIAHYKHISNPKVRKQLWGLLRK